jgi:hypothetical protein
MVKEKFRQTTRNPTLTFSLALRASYDPVVVVAVCHGVIIKKLINLLQLSAQICDYGSDGLPKVDPFRP